MGEVKSIRKIDLTDREDVFLVSNYRPDNELSLTILDLNKGEAFSGDITDTELKKLAAIIRMTFSVFVDLTIKAFTQDEYDGLKFFHTLEENCQDFLFKWKSKDSDETTITIGNIKMKKKEYKWMVKNVFLMLSGELTTLNQEVFNTKASLKNAEKEKEETLSLLVEATRIKENIEKELYSKFILVLNEKKRKIRELTKHELGTVLKKAKLSKPSKKVHQISDSDTDVDSPPYASTHEDDYDSTPEIEIPSDDTVSKAGPSNLKHDCSLFLDDEPVIAVSPTKVRNRKIASRVVVEGLSSNVQETLSQICDSESEDDLLMNL